EHPEHWWIPAETLRPNEPVKEGAWRVAATWFGEETADALDIQVKDVITWPYEGGGEPKWYILHLFEAQVDGELPLLEDTAEVRFVEPGTQAPGAFAMGHGDVWPLLE
ncbi:MAG: hypothetical protein R3185_08595, partial [Candidatus Thermoplasmatota archaeon]|nr:hypothetical protein [Candidatus Thermoplasmatota archaeon]